MTERELDPGIEIARIKKMINSGPMQRMRKAVRAEGKVITPKNASSIILVRGESGKEQVVMGKRNKALKFMPGALVFPGGRVDRADGIIQTTDSLDSTTMDKLLLNMRGKPTERRVRALGTAAIRELAEETGILIGKSAANPPAHKDWAMFARRSMAPSVASLRLLARAITPPGVHRRFDTWFFIMRLEDHHHIPSPGFVPSGELEDLQWISPYEAMGTETREITRVILVELMNRLKKDPGLNPDFPAPSYSTRNHKFYRKII